MMNKRDFLRGGAAVVVASAGSAAAVAATRPSLSEHAGLASWQAHLGQPFEVDSHAVVLKTASARSGGRLDEQFSLSFEGRLPDGIGDGLHLLTTPSGASLPLYLARTQLGLRADFCRLQG
ncbi:DUF6916 family protein [Roseateles sp. BYS78W]|uniref:DUF6916 family protein n=1 Tax=Pelomonas candidula TaxID=3299025 RepID=A0ABW7HII9_9BURK